MGVFCGFFSPIKNESQGKGKILSTSQNKIRIRTNQEYVKFVCRHALAVRDHSGIELW